MPLNKLAQSLTGTCRHCGQKTGILQRIHPECRRTHQAGVLLLAHPPKSGSDYSGSTDWLAGVRALWTLGPRRGSFMPHAELATSWRMNTSGCRFCRRSAPAPDAGAGGPGRGRRPGPPPGLPAPIPGLRPGPGQRFFQGCPTTGPGGAKD